MPQQPRLVPPQPGKQTEETDPKFLMSILLDCLEKTEAAQDQVIYAFNQCISNNRFRNKEHRLGALVITLPLGNLCVSHYFST